MDIWGRGRAYIWGRGRANICGRNRVIYEIVIIFVVEVG